MSQETDDKRLFIIDGVSYAYRSFYAIQRLSNSEGFPTNAVFGFLRTLKKLIQDFKPEYLVAVFDPKGPTVRHETYDQYKIHRKPMPEDLVIQMPVIKDMLRAMRIPVLEIPKYEADDLMATLARRAGKDDFTVYLATGDKDMFQLVNDRIRILHTHKNNEVYGPDEVKDKYGITPGQFIDYLALAGDSSDNIPGVPGIGEKTAIELLKKYGSLEEIFNHADEISGTKRRENIVNNREKADISRRLVILDDSVQFDMDIEDAKLGEPDIEKLAQLYRSLGFNRDYEELISESRPVTTSNNYRVVLKESELSGMVERLEKIDKLTIDLQVDGDTAMTSEAVGIALSSEDSNLYYIPLNADISQGVIIQKLKPLLENPRLAVTGHDIKKAFIVLKNAGISLSNMAFDTMIAAYLVEPSRTDYSLGALVLEYLNRRLSIPAEGGRGKKQPGPGDMNVESLAPVACAMVSAIRGLEEALRVQMDARKLTELFNTIEMPLVRVLAEMEMHGVCVDVPFLKSMSTDFEVQLKELEGRIYSLADERFNINSPKQLSVILFDKLKLPAQRKTKTGASTDISVLEKLSLIHELPKVILEYRQIAKLKSTYIDALPQLVNPRTNRIHTSFNQTITTTGRLSSSNPNLQNIPVRTDEGKKIRQAFIPPGDCWCLLSADYSQIELRIFAHLAGEQEMIKAFLKGEDIHAYTASLVYEVPIENVTPEMRHRAKAVNFGIIYGQQAYGLSNFLKISVPEAQRFIDNYLLRYPKVKQFMDNTIQSAKRLGYVTTLFGRRRYIPELKSSSRQTQQLGERLAINTPIQGSAADIIKIAMIRIPKRLKDENMKTAMILQIHDELLFEVPDDEKDLAGKIVQEEMSSVVKLDVPLEVEVAFGANWKEA